MKATVDQGALARFLGWLAVVLPSRPEPGNPLSGGIRLEAWAGGQLSGLATGSDTHVDLIGAQVGEPGAVVVPAALARDLVKALPAGPVELVAQGATLTLAAGAAHYQLGTLPADGYSLAPSWRAQGIEAPLGTRDQVAAMAATVAPAVDHGTYPNLEGLRIELGPDGLTLAGLMPHRLLAVTVPYVGPEAAVRLPLGPFRAALDLADPGELIELHMGDHGATLSSPGGHRLAYLRRYADKPMAWRAKLTRTRADDTCSAIVEGAELGAALDRIQLAAEGRPVWVRIEGGALALDLSQTYGPVTAHEAVSAEVFGAAHFLINPRYLAETIRVCGDEAGHVYLGYQESIRRQPVIIRPAIAQANRVVIGVLSQVHDTESLRA